LRDLVKDRSVLNEAMPFVFSIDDSMDLSANFLLQFID
jgi:hypothetical protein